MPSRAIKPKRDDEPRAGGGGWQGLAERAPSIMRPEQASTGRIVALIGLFPLTLGAAAIFFSAIGKNYLISVAWGVFLLVIGVAMVLYHAFNERDLQYRRLYGLLGGVFLGLALLFRLLPYENVLGGLFLPYGTPCLLLALGFLASFARNETDEAYRRLTLALLGVVSLACAFLGLIGGLVSETFMAGQGAVLLALGLLYAAVYIGMQDSGSERGYRAGLGVGVLGGLMIVLALGISFVPDLLFQWGWLSSRPTTSFFMPRGLLLLYLGLEYLLLAFGTCSESRLAVLTRRELASFFYSPIVYIVLIVSSIIGWYSFWSLLGKVTDPRYGPTTERVFTLFVVDLVPVFSVVFMVPLLTMRLLSEEKRTGSLEVLLTAPVNETTVVLSKFFAALRVFLLGFYPWGLFLLALRVEGGEPFDYRPILTFFIALIAMGVGWIGMGLFFSSLTRNQIAAAALTLVAMLGAVVIYFLKMFVERGSTWHNILYHISFIDLWIASSQGSLAPRYLLFHLSAGVFWLFLTIKVLEARKWA
jgi:ABC-type transport system involved in multi-copper enzyme maturation permease subunit